MFELRVVPTLRNTWIDSRLFHHGFLTWSYRGGRMYLFQIGILNVTK